ncbi:MAG: penicillin-binding protein activator [Gammaproteobacteria bacterium]|nr:penicillin-binding protein activator [Gammaproteobacteria bacterium]
MTHNPIRFPARLLPLGLALATLLLLIACTTPPKHEEEAAAAATPQVIAARQLAAGDYRGAAQLLLQQAAQAQPPQREDLQLGAAEALLRGGFTEDAARILEKLPPSGSAAYQTRLALAQARVFIGRQQPQAALQRLAAVSDSVPPEQMLAFNRTRADAYTAAGNHLESARERVWMDGLLEPSAQAGNHQAIWESLSKLPDAVLANMRTAAPPDVFSGWLELVETTRALRDSPPQLDIALAIWRERYPGHPAIPAFIDALQGRTQEITQSLQPEAHIAVLLPLSGALAEAGQAVRDGMLAAHFQTPDASPQRLRFYDTGPGLDRVWNLYQRAVSEGAQQVVGPLSKEAVATLAGAGTLTVPVLALNNLPDNKPAPAQLYQFSLSPEDEAEQVAARAWEDGHRRALVLVPENTMGQRVLQSFTQHWQALGGTLLDVQPYGSDQNTYSDSVIDLLKLNASTQRQQTLTRLLGQKPGFVPRVRQDADFVFLAGAPEQARSLLPLLRFHHAAQLPVYSTSQVYDSTSTATQNRDLDGLRFCDMPWMLPTAHPGTALRGEIARLWPARAQRYTRLYALGIDALQVLPNLRGLQDGSFSRHPGVTGDLYLDKDRRIHRELQWAQFINGQPSALPESAPGAATPSTTPQSPPQDITDEYPASTTQNSPSSAPGAAR